MKIKPFVPLLFGAGLLFSASPVQAFGMLGADEEAGVYNSDFSAVTSSQIPLFGEVTVDNITAKVTRGINPDGTNGSLGAFSEFTQFSDNVVTLDFNDGVVQNGSSYTFNGQSDIVFNWDAGGNTGIKNDRWAPSGAYGEVNTSDYLAVFRGNDVTISLQEDLNYFGIDWGALSSGNEFAFYDNDQLLSAFTYEDINPDAPVQADQHFGESNAYLHFYANQAQGTFNRIVISQTTGGGFETDNYSLRYGEEAFDFETGQDVPFEVESTLGLLLLSMGVIGHRMKKSKVKRTAIA